jgi:hypothetical protein
MFSRSPYLEQHEFDLRASLQGMVDLLFSRAHEKNIELMAAGIFNPWIQRSLDQLAALMPGRYAKFETSPGFIASIDRYAYRVPGVAGTAAEESEAGVGPESGEPASEPAADSEGEPVPEQSPAEAVGAA